MYKVSGNNGKDYALKYIDVPQDVSYDFSNSNQNNQLQEYMNEIVILKNVKHKHIVAMHDYSITNKLIMIVMDYYPCNIWWFFIKCLIRWRFKQIFGRTKIKGD